jgi:hypothetical protein
MRDRAGAQVSSPRDERSIENSQRNDYHHLLPALVRVDQPKHQGLQNNSDYEAACRGTELLLQVTSVNDLFTDSSGDRQQNPQQNFHQAGRRMVWRRLCLRSLDGMMN